MLKVQLLFFCIAFVSASRLLRRELETEEATGTVCINWFGNNLDWENIPFESMADNSPWGFTPNGCTEATVEPYGVYACATYDYSSGSPQIKMCNGDCFDGVCVIDVTLEPTSAPTLESACINWFGNNLDWDSMPFESTAEMSPWGYTPEGCTEAIVEPYGEYICATYDYSSGSIMRCNGDCFDGVCANGHATQEPTNVCSVGEELIGGDCWPCTPGNFNANVGGVCSACPKGTYASEFGSGACTFCEIGFVAPNEASQACEACPEGYTTEVFGQTECVPESTPEPTPQPTSQPTICSVGEELLGSSCVPCVPGTYNAHVGGICEVCSEGTAASDLGSEACTPCDIGFIAPLVGLQNCMVCPEGFTTDGFGQTECVPETTEEPTLEPTLEPEVCSVGEELLEGACVACVPGTYNEIVGGVCASCPEGTFASDVGSIACTPCDIGFNAPVVGLESCMACPEGYTTDGFGQTECIAETTNEPTQEPTAENWEVIYHQTKLTCFNKGQKISQPCNGGRGTGCSYDTCMQHCFDEEECNFFFYITSRSGCILYDSCDLTRTPAYSGTTVQITRN